MTPAHRTLRTKITVNFTKLVLVSLLSPAFFLCGTSVGPVCSTPTLLRPLQ